MTYIVYVSKQCQSDAQKHGFVSALEKLKTDIENRQNLSLFDRFGSSPYLVRKKFAGKQGRLLAVEETFSINGNDANCIVFLRILIRGDKEYDAFVHKEESRTRYKNAVARDDIITFLDKRLAKDPPRTKQSLATEEEAYLYASSKINLDYDNSDMILETDDWVRAVTRESFASILPWIYETVVQISETFDNEQHEISVKNRNSYRIIFDKSEGIIYLVDIREKTDQDIDAVSIIRNWKKDIADNRPTAKRGYPRYILADDTLWLEIEKDEQSNFVLSREEIEVLNACTNSQEGCFPLFINGRAGSGKSTMLQYLFADYFARYISYQDSIEHSPVYFTYNAELLRRARTFVEGLITRNSAFETTTGTPTDKNFILQKIGESFKELKSYLLSLVDDANKVNFDKNNYVNFTRFKSLWHDKYGKDRTAARDYSADISWHIIRTYIEGYDTEGFLDTEDYREIETKQKTVSEQTYRLVFDIVWKWYAEEKRKANLWDDQDLVRFILEHDLAQPLFPGIFCDEAQDFTRLEMEIFLRLSLFSDRNIKKQHITRIPFAFAGDEMQTLNPTGFRWDSLKAGFTQKFILPMLQDAGDRSTGMPMLNYRELEHNYRSQPAIVKFCNALQLFRAVKFDISDLNPQNPWNDNMPGQSPAVVSFISDDSSFWEGIKKLPDTVFIVPCDEEQELEWVGKDDVLKQRILIKNNATMPPVLSANRAKGLEFSRVVVYGFGAYCPPGLESQETDESKMMPLQYHINKTYVAISRAKKQLFILDSENGLDGFWTVTGKENSADNSLKRINSGNKTKWSKNDLSFLIPGGQQNLLKDGEANIEINAEQFRNSGISERSPYMMRQAAICYRELKNDVNANKCEADAFVFDKDYLMAGEKYIASGWLDEAVKSYWLSDCDDGYKFIVDRTSRNPKYVLRFHIARAMTSSDGGVITEAIDKVLQASKENLFDVFKGDTVFPEQDMRTVLNSAINKVLRKFSVHIDPTGDSVVLHRIIDSRKNGIDIDNEIIGDIAFKFAEYKIAKEYYDKSERGKLNKNYEEVVSFCASYPDKLPLLKKMGKWDEICKEYQENHEVSLSNEFKIIVVEAFIMKKMFDEALDICSSITGRDAFKHLLDLAKSQNAAKRFKDVVYIFSKLEIIREENWDNTWEMLQDQKNNKNTNTFNLVYLAASIARTNSVPTSGKISDYLREVSKLDIPDAFIFDVGVAIEKAGRHIDALKYYEKYTDKSNDYVERWIKEKERHAEYYKEKGNEVEYQKCRQEADHKRREYGIPENKDIAEYANLSSWEDMYERIIQNEMADKPNLPVVVKVAHRKSTTSNVESPINTEDKIKPVSKKVCAACGKPIESDWKVCPYCKTEIVSESICTGCGRKLEPEWVICPFCKTEPQRGS